MLSERPWNIETCLRLMLGVLLCLFIGAVIASMFHYTGPAARRGVFYVSALASILLLAIASALLSQPWKLENLSSRLLMMTFSLSAGLAFALWSQKIAGPPQEIPSG